MSAHGSGSVGEAPARLAFASAQLRHEVETFLHHEAELLDEWRLQEWLALFTPDCSYLVPSTDVPDGNPDDHLFFIRDDYFLLSQRVQALLDGTAWAENPKSTTHRMVTNVRPVEHADGTIVVKANGLVHRSSGPRLDAYPTRYTYHLVRGGAAGFEIRHRRAVLAMEQLRPVGRVSIIL